LKGDDRRYRNSELLSIVGMRVRMNIMFNFVNGLAEEEGEGCFGCDIELAGGTEEGVRDCGEGGRELKNMIEKELRLGKE
jgi:hypothetical protein